MSFSTAPFSPRCGSLWALCASASMGSTTSSAIPSHHQACRISSLESSDRTLPRGRSASGTRNAWLMLAGGREPATGAGAYSRPAPATVEKCRTRIDGRIRVSPAASAPPRVVPAPPQPARLAPQRLPTTSHPTGKIHVDRVPQASSDAAVVGRTLSSPPRTRRLGDPLDHLFDFGLALQIETGVVHGQIGL